jgi:hypothetical protein
MKEGAFMPRNAPGNLLLRAPSAKVDTSAATLKFRSALRIFIGTSKSKPHWNQGFAGAPLIPKFATEGAAI